jgi:hypothetical protein
MRRLAALLAVGLLATAQISHAAQPPDRSRVKSCSGYAIQGGVVTAMAIRATTCTAARRIIQRLYRGENDGFRRNEVFVDGWGCVSGTGLTTACRRRSGREGTIRAHYKLD